MKQKTLREDAHSREAEICNDISCNPCAFKSIIKKYEEKHETM